MPELKPLLITPEYKSDNLTWRIILSCNYFVSPHLNVALLFSTWALIIVQTRVYCLYVVFSINWHDCGE